MQIDTELREMFSYSIILIIPLLLLIILLLIIILHKKKDIKNVKIIQPSSKNLIDIKNKYLYNIQILIEDLNANKISERIAYQSLSRLIRNFIYEVTNIKVQYYTLEDIKKINMPILSKLVEEYYNPEFERVSKGNVLESIDKTKKVIENWK